MNEISLSFGTSRDKTNVIRQSQNCTYDNCETPFVNYNTIDILFLLLPGTVEAL